MPKLYIVNNEDDILEILNSLATPGKRAIDKKRDAAVAEAKARASNDIDKRDREKILAKVAPTETPTPRKFAIVGRVPRILLQDEMVSYVEIPFSGSVLTALLFQPDKFIPAPASEVIRNRAKLVPRSAEDVRRFFIHEPSKTVVYSMDGYVNILPVSTAVLEQLKAMKAVQVHRIFDVYHGKAEV